MILVPRTIHESNVLRQWLEARLPDLMLGDDSWCIGIVRDGDIVAVAGFNNYRHTDIELSFAADHPRWATRQTITQILAFPFVQLETQRCTALVPKHRKRARRLLLGLGFKEEGAHRHAGQNKETIFSYGMTRDTYLERYIHEQQKSAYAAAGARSDADHSGASASQPH